MQNRKGKEYTLDDMFAEKQSGIKKSIEEIISDVKKELAPEAPEDNNQFNDSFDSKSLEVNKVNKIILNFSSNFFCSFWRIQNMTKKKIQKFI